MFSKFKRFSLSIVAFVLIASFLAACNTGPDPQKYSDKLKVLMGNYTQTFSYAMVKVSSAKDAAQLADASYQSQAFDALKSWEHAGAELGAIPDNEVPKGFEEFNGILKEVSQQTSASVKEITAAIEADNIDALLTAVKNLDKITALLSKASNALPSK